MFDSFKHHPVGTPLPDDIHAVSCSLPTMDDIIGYEEKKPDIIQKLEAGYPRFTRHKLITKIATCFAAELNISAEYVFILASKDFILQLIEFIGLDNHANGDQLILHPHKSLCVVYTKNSKIRQITHKFLQHTGASITSREAQDYLDNKSGTFKVNQKQNQYEPRHQAAQTIKKILKNKHRVCESDDIYLGRSGMSCFFAAFLALNNIQKMQKKTIWIQLGWLYVDTIELLKSYTINPGDYVHFSDLLNLEPMERFIQQNHDQIAGVVTESPTNPLIQTMDIEKIYNLCQKYDISVILDPTIASPHNIKCLEYSDVTINSLTKYTAHKGNIMMGSLALNPESKYYSQIKSTLNDYLIEPYERDLLELSKQILNYDEIVTRMNYNNIKLVEYLQSHSSVKEVHHAYHKKYTQNYSRLTWEKNSPGCLISIELKMPIRQFYDQIKIAKGPSLGQDFTIICPFIYLAHYELIQSESGREILNNNKIPIDLIRISIGTEDHEMIIKAFDDVLH